MRGAKPVNFPVSSGFAKFSPHISVEHANVNEPLRCNGQNLICSQTHWLLKKNKQTKKLACSRRSDSGAERRKKSEETPQSLLIFFSALDIFRSRACSQYFSFVRHYLNAWNRLKKDQ